MVYTWNRKKTNAVELKDVQPISSKTQLLELLEDANAQTVALANLPINLSSTGIAVMKISINEVNVTVTLTNFMGQRSFHVITKKDIKLSTANKVADHLFPS